MEPRGAPCPYPFYGFFFLRRHLDVVHLGGLIPNGAHLALEVAQLTQWLVQHLDELLLVLADLLAQGGRGVS